jgi:hypothetical protein
MLPPSRRGITETNWNLGYFNSLQFNFYSTIPSAPARAAFPFAARWQGVVSPPPNQRIVVTYVGEGTVRLDDEIVLLPRAYRRPATLSLSLCPRRLGCIRW